ncbi:hypothetical protein sp82g_71 [Bacillus phage SP82G]|nr:hypothetical protein sp82g_71 [Bacillus phage SP82G]
MGLHVQKSQLSVIKLGDYGAVGGGVTDDTTSFINLEAEHKGKIINLEFKTYLVDKGFSGNFYINGSFKVGDNTFAAPYTLPYANNSNIFMGENSGVNTDKYPVYMASAGGYSNIGIGKNALKSNTEGWRNVAIGDGALVNNTLGHYNIAVGDEALRDNIGSRNGDSTDNGSRNTAVGSNTMCYNTTGYCNTAMGRNALHTNFTGYHNTAIGAAALSGNAPYVNGVVVPDDPKHGNYNTAVGSEALFRGNSDHNTAVGRSAAWNTKNGARNVAIGSEALYYNEANVTYDDKTTAGAGNTAVGTAAMKYMQDGSQATLVNNSSAIGYGARVSGDNQVQLGGSGTTTYSYGAVQSRSDQRDKTDIKDTELGLDFLLKVRPVDFRWDYRDDYQEIDEEGNLITHEKDGSRSGNRFHHGVIAQEIQEVIQKTGKDFGGLQDHKINGGTDVLSIGYEEFIAPIIKSIHELHKMVSDLSDRISELENK